MRILASVFVTCLAGQAGAACQSGMEIFMSCTFNNGAKTVEVCANGATASYRFGPTKGQPELALTVPASQIDYAPWPGVGRSIFESVTFHNSGVSYEVFAGVDREATANNQRGDAFGGITVFQKGTEIAALECDPGSVYFPWTDVLSR